MKPSGALRIVCRGLRCRSISELWPPGAPCHRKCNFSGMPWSGMSSRTGHPSTTPPASPATIYLSVPTTVSPRSEKSKFRSRGPLRSFLHSLLRWVECLWLRVCWYYRFRCLLLLRLSLSAIGCWPRSSSRSQARGATRVRCAMSWRIAHVDLRQPISSLIRASGASTCSITRCMPGSSCSIRSQATEASIISSRF